MHIKKLKLKNFKSHADTTIEFGLITSIIGKNDCGKTNILRALKTLLQHTNWPASWIKYGEESSSIQLQLEDGSIVERKRTLKGQSVFITKNGVVKDLTGKKDAQQYVEEVIGIKKVTLDEVTGPEDLNFVDVHAEPALLGARSDTAQRKIAGIVGANKIDDARTRLTKQAKKLETKAEELTTELDFLRPLFDREKSTLDRCTDIITNVNDLDNKWNHYQTQLEKLKNINEHLSTSNTTTNNVVKEMSDKLDLIRSLKQTLEELTRSLSYLKSIEQEFIGNDLSILIDGRDALLNLKFSHKNKLDQLEALKELRSRLSLDEASVNEQQIELYEAQTSYDNLKQEKLLALNKLTVCPTCGNKL